MKIVALPDTGIRIAYSDLAGSTREATPRVYLHGLGSSAIAIFPEIASDPRLAGPRSLLIDLPGFGYSTAEPTWSYTIEDQADAVIHALDVLGIPRCDLVGHSMGGSVAISIAARRPDLVRRLVVAEPNLDPGKGTLSLHIAKRREADFLARGHALLLRSTQQQAKRGDAGAAIFLATLRQASVVALHRAATSLLAERSPTLREQLRDAPMPRTFMQGTRSETVAAQDLRDAGVGWIEIADAGHVMMLDNPDAFIAAIALALQVGDCVLRGHEPERHRKTKTRG